MIESNQRPSNSPGWSLKLPELSLAIAITGLIFSTILFINVLEGVGFQLYFYLVLFSLGAAVGIASWIVVPQRRPAAVIGVMLNVLLLIWRCGTLWAAM